MLDVSTNICNNFRKNISIFFVPSVPVVHNYILLIYLSKNVFQSIIIILTPLIRIWHVNLLPINIFYCICRCFHYIFCLYIFHARFFLFQSIIIILTPLIRIWHVNLLSINIFYCICRCFHYIFCLYIFHARFFVCSCD